MNWNYELIIVRGESIFIARQINGAMIHTFEHIIY